MLNMNGHKDKFLYEAFHEYLDKCASISRVMWDSVASEDLIHSSGARWEFFIREFQESEEFKFLCEEMEKRDSARPDSDDYYVESGRLWLY